jgi:RNA polymerase sigma-70 factor
MLSENTELDRLIATAYSEAYKRHGDIGVKLETFAHQVKSVVRKHMGERPLPDAVNAFLTELHTSDLYLATGCAVHSEIAWQLFTSTYRKFVDRLARLFCKTRDTAHDLADNVLTDLLLPDRSGRSRITSYDGRSSLSTWLRVIMSHRAINEYKRKGNTASTFDTSEISDLPALGVMELTFDLDRYEGVLQDSLQTACESLAAQERLMLLWRYEEGLQLGQIARLLGIHQSTVTRQLDRIQERLRTKVMSILASRHGLGEADIEECLKDLVENPFHSISVIDLIKELPGPAQQEVSQVSSLMGEGASTDWHPPRRCTAVSRRAHHGSRRAVAAVGGREIA